MKSGWLVIYRTGYRCIMTELEYLKFKLGSMKDVECLEHWFSIEEAKRKNPNLEVFGERD